MKKPAIILLVSSLLYCVGRSAFTATHHRPTTIIDEAAFINMIRDLELLNSWLRCRYFPKETIERLRNENHQKILALYKVDPQAFEESIKYYLEDARALQVYEKVYLALEAL